MDEAPHLYAVGDVHGDVVRLERLLSGAKLVDAAGNWAGGDSALVLTGDLTDRGDRGIETIAFVRRLQERGRVEALMGNHDALILARAFEFRGQRADPDCRDLFRLNGGRDREARALADDESAFAWMQARPMMLRVGTTLFQHADTTMFYRELAPQGGVEDANAAGAVLAATARGAWQIFYDMTDGREWDVAYLRTAAEIRARFGEHLERFGAERVVHGHTRHVGQTPLVYLDDRAINVDGTLSEGYRRNPDRGFVADLGPLQE